MRWLQMYASCVTPHMAVTGKAGCHLGLPLRETLYTQSYGRMDPYLRAPKPKAESTFQCVRERLSCQEEQHPRPPPYVHHHQLLLRHPSKAPTQLSSRHRCALSGVVSGFQLDAVSFLRVGLALVEVDPEQEGDGEQVPRDHQ